MLIVCWQEWKFISLEKIFLYSTLAAVSWEVFQSVEDLNTMLSLPWCNWKSDNCHPQGSQHFRSEKILLLGEVILCIILEVFPYTLDVLEERKLKKRFSLISNPKIYFQIRSNILQKPFFSS